MLNNETYQVLLPESILQNASYLDALTEDDLKMLNELKDNETNNLEGDGMENGGADEMGEGAEEMGEEEMVDEYVEKGYRKGNKKVIKTRAQKRCPTCRKSS